MFPIRIPPDPALPDICRVTCGYPEEGCRSHPAAGTRNILEKGQTETSVQIARKIVTYNEDLFSIPLSNIQGHVKQKGGSDGSLTMKIIITHTAYL